MAWLESHQSLPKHPKTKRLRRELGLTGPQAVGLLHFLWWWALDFAQDGEITQYDAYDIADACEWEDDAEDFLGALISSGFIDVIEDRRFIHDWHDYAGKLIEIRKKDAERKRRERGKPRKDDGSPTDVQGMSEGHLPESIRDLNLDLNPNTKTSSSSGYRISGNGAFAIYQRQFGEIDEITTGLIADLMATYTEAWVVKAMTVAIKQKLTKLSYVEGILVKWKALNVENPWDVEKKEQTRQPQQGYGRRTPQPSRPLLTVAKSDAPEASEEDVKRILEMAKRLG